MPTHQISYDDAVRTVEAVEEALRKGYRKYKSPSPYNYASEKLKLDHSTIRKRLRSALKQFNLEPDWSIGSPIGDTPEESSADVVDLEQISRKLRMQQYSLDELSTVLKITRGQALDGIDVLKEKGFHIRQHGVVYWIERDPEPGFIGGPNLEFESDEKSEFVFGALGDSHLGSKYERLDVLNALYDRYQEEGCTHVFHTGNWIEGESRFNRTDLSVHGLDAQCRYLAENFPKRDGITTYAVSGDDHEGWYAQREGIDIGAYAQQCFRDLGRDDWVNMGYMEAHVALKNANSSAASIMAVVHPGGGSAYAMSYSIQKIIESLEGGEKPAVALYGHYHKLWAGNIRNVWCIQTGCQKDQDTFMRKKKLAAHVGGVLVKLRQDPATGAIVECMPNMIRYFNRGFYTGRWSPHGQVVLAEREVNYGGTGKAGKGRKKK